MARSKKRRPLADAFGTEASSPRAHAASEPSTPVEVAETIPIRDGKLVSAETPVNMTFTVTARERYLWNLELRRRGLSAVSVLRSAMNELLEED
jgi:hypothetical protein